MTESDYAKLKNVRISKYLKAIESLGYRCNRSSGSHMIYTAINRPTLSIPNHDTIAPGTWRNIGKLLKLA
jgi:predicted RNA binding protein YcfA (HicA-like mRNA interferase family)